MKVLKKQYNSHDCLVCGIDNELGLKTAFYEMANGVVVGVLKGKNEHQSYPNRMHGGVISALIDETIGRAIWITSPYMLGVTTHLNITYRKIVPLNEPLFVIGKITKENKRIFEGKGVIVNMNHEFLAEGTALYFKLPFEKMEMGLSSRDEMDVYIDDNVTDIDIDDIIF